MCRGIVGIMVFNIVYWGLFCYTQLCTQKEVLSSCFFSKKAETLSKRTQFVI